jgi:hypothetical protein
MPFRYFKVCIDFIDFFCFVFFGSEIIGDNAKKVFTIGIFKANIR